MIRFFFACLFCLSAFFATTFAPVLAQPTDKPESKDEKKALNKAEEFLKYEEYRSALEQLNIAYKLNPNNIFTNYYMGKCYYKIGLKGKAVPVLSFVVSQDSTYNSGELYSLYAQCLHHALKLDDAIKYYQKDNAFYKQNHPRHAENDTYIQQCKNAKELMKDPVTVEIENAGEAVNSRYPDFGPVITADESKLFFTTRREGNLGNQATDGLPHEDVWFTERDENGAWKPAKPIGLPINTNYHDATISISPDGQEIYLYRDLNNGGIFHCKLKGDKWTEPLQEGKPIKTKFREPSASLSPDGRVIYFTSDRPGGFGGLDIYYAMKLPNGKWAEPINMGPSINTPFDEDGPFIHPDNKSLYFSSKGHNSMGGYDIFKTVWLPDQKKWTKPTNIGYPVNTADDDIYFVLSANGAHGYYASAREGGFGEKDIYRITFVKSQLAVTKAKQSKPEFKPDDVKLEADLVALPTVDLQMPSLSVTILKGVVRDMKTEKPLEAQIYIIDVNDNDTIYTLNSNSLSGSYLISLPGGRNYGIYVEAPNYSFHSENFQVSNSDGYTEVAKDIELQNFAIGSTVILKNIFFDFDKTTLRKISFNELQKLKEMLIDNPKLRIKINGHTDNVGNADYNMKLSEGRAKEVVEWLIKQGIRRDRLEYEGYGLTKPIESNATEEGRQTNRRTEFEIIGN